MKKIITLGLLVLMQINVFSQCIEGNGTIINDSIFTPNIENLKILAGINLVEVNEASSQSIIISGDSNILDSLDVHSSRDTLIVKFPISSCYSNYELTININTPNVKGIDFSGSGNVKINDFNNTSSLSIINNGSGNIDVAAYAMATFLNISNNGSGSISMLSDFPNLRKYEISNFGSGNYYGCLLSVDTCIISNNGSGFVSVSTKDYLDVEIFGSGDIEYFGSPQILSSIFGSGELLEGKSSDCNLTTSTSDFDIFNNTNELVKVFPNPTNGVLNLIGDFNEKSGIILNLLGEQLIQFNHSNETQLDIGHLPSGIYILKIGEHSVSIMRQ